MAPLETCKFCGTTLQWRAGNAVIVFTAHDEAFCKGTMLGTIRSLEGALRSQSEVMAQTLCSAGRREALAEKERDQLRHEVAQLRCSLSEVLDRGHRHPPTGENVPARRATEDPKGVDRG